MRVVSRTKPAELRLQDPYHLDRYQSVPEVTIEDAWFQADASGEVAQRYTLVTDEKGVVQESSRVSNAEEFNYSVGDNLVERVPAPTAGFNDSVLETIDAPSVPSGATVKSAGTAQIAGIDTKVVEVDSPPVNLLNDEVAYERPYVRDLAPSLVRVLYNIDPTDGAVLSHTIDLVNGQTSVRVSERTVLAMETVSATDLPSDFFELKHAAGVPRLETTVLTPNANGFQADSLDDPRLAGRNVVSVDAADTLGLSLVGVSAATTRVNPPAGSGDARFADAYGLATTTEYRGAPDASGQRATLRIVTGSATDLVPLLRSALPFWSKSSQVTVSPSGVSSSAWLVEGSDEYMVILERDGSLVMWDAQGMSSDALLRIVSASSEVK